jgi:hypothetical protein
MPRESEMGMENAVFFNKLAIMDKTRNIAYKESLTF